MTGTDREQNTDPRTTEAHVAIRRVIECLPGVNAGNTTEAIEQAIHAAGYQVVTNDPQWDVIAAVADAAWFEPDDAKEAIGRLRERGYEVVTNDLLEAATELLERRVAEDTCCDDCTPFVDPVRDRLAACLAAHRGDDPLNVFTEGGA